MLTLLATAPAHMVEAGPIGLLVVAALIGACVFLFRSMNKQLRKVPPSFDPPPGDSEHDSDR